MFVTTWAKLLVSLLAITVRASSRDYHANDYFSVHLDSLASPLELARSVGAQLEGPIGQLADHYTFSVPKERSAPVEDGIRDLRRKRRKREIAGDRGVLWYQKQSLRPRLEKRIPPPPPPSLPSSRQKFHPSAPVKEEASAVEAMQAVASALQIGDPIFMTQWHILNTQQPGHDLNVTGVWMQGITGNGSITSVIDDGIDMYSNDLKDNYFAPGSCDYNNPGPEPKPRLSDDHHGTRCAGEIAAGRNDVCGVGMAYDGQVSGIRILSEAISDEDESAAINFGFQDNQIYSCSWGPPDDGKTMDAPNTLIHRAIVNGVQRGRGGLGSVFVFAAGNGAAAGDNCNFDGYTNSIYSVTVGGIDREGHHPYYSEHCSAQLVVAYSSGPQDGIHTTDVGPDSCSYSHGGTSAAGPLVAGTIALALSIRPNLSWRDIQHLCVQTALPLHLDDGSWQQTEIGKNFSHTFGYGKVDAWRLVEAAKDFTPVKAQAWFHSPWLSVQHPIPEGNVGLASSFEITQDILTKANLERLEHVTVTMNVDHTCRGDLSVDLKSPSGVVSHLSTVRPKDEDESGYIDWTFMSVAHW
jgi:kexin